MNKTLKDKLNSSIYTLIISAYTLSLYYLYYKQTLLLV